MSRTREKLQHVIAFRCGDDHHSALSVIANDNGNSVSRVARSIVLAKLRSDAPGGGAIEEQTAHIQALLADVAGIRSDVMRLRAAADSSAPHATEDLEATLAELFTEVAELRGELARLRNTWVESLGLILLNVCKISPEEVARLVTNKFGGVS